MEVRQRLRLAPVADWPRRPARHPQATIAVLAAEPLEVSAEQAIATPQEPLGRLASLPLWLGLRALLGSLLTLLARLARLVVALAH